MTRPITHELDPSLDLLLERIVDVPRALVWKAWTTPDVLMKWFTPDPWKTVECQIDLRPGGAFRTVMQSPEGELFPNVGCYIEVVENETLIWTNALTPGYRPATRPGDAPEDLIFTAVISLEPVGEGTRYTARVIHADAESCARHAAMGFHDGWGAALTQLVAVAQGRRG
jgi:uncharacterized protein YndB with AHSA1/START domain